MIKLDIPRKDKAFPHGFLSVAERIKHKKKTCSM